MGVGDAFRRNVNFPIAGPREHLAYTSRKGAALISDAYMLAVRDILFPTGFAVALQVVHDWLQRDSLTAQLAPHLPELKCPDKYPSKINLPTAKKSNMLYEGTQAVVGTILTLGVATHAISAHGSAAWNGEEFVIGENLNKSYFKGINDSVAADVARCVAVAARKAIEDAIELELKAADRKRQGLLSDAKAAESKWKKAAEELKIFADSFQG